MVKQHPPTDHGALSNDLADWYPVVSATGVPVPRTVTVPIPESLFDSILDEMQPGDPDFPADARVALDAVIAILTTVGTPAFVRTGEMSAKHSWGHSCALDDAVNLLPNLFTLFETQAMAWGVPAPKHLVCREMLNTDHLFYAFDGMPITKERRYYATDGIVNDHAPYWPIGAIIGHRPRDVEGCELPDERWTAILRSASVESAEEIAELTALTERAAVPLKGSWSVDWLWTTDRGWVFIDAAHEERSYRMNADERAALRI